MPVNTKQKNLRIVEVSDKSFHQAWNSFLINYPQYSCYYQLPVIEYNKMLSKEVIDQSFILKNDDISLVICVLVFEKLDGRFQASWSKGMFLPVPLFHNELSEKQQRSLEGFVFEEIKARITKFEINRLFYQADVLSIDHDKIEDYMLAGFGALDVSSYHHIIDLGLSDEAIWDQIRHSSKNIINRGFKTYEFKVYDMSNFSDDIGTRHRLLHHKTAGRITRPVETFQKMYSWVDDGCGLMFEQVLDGQVVQMIFVALGKATAVGKSAADDPDIEIIVPLTHSMNYFIYKELKRRGIRYYDSGETAFRSDLYKIFTSKELKINYFKRGFSDRSYPLKQWIWFSNLDEEVKYLHERMLLYEKFLSNTINPQ